ncbi:MAG: hypothetical protein ABJE66_36600 [Deltaproteobacteria bacterium]
MTPFAAILRRCVDASPHAIGAAFADSEGEMVDSYAKTMSANDWAILTAHYGVVLGQLVSAFGTLHFGGPEFFIARHDRIEVIVHAVEHGYYALLAFSQPPEIELALERVRIAADALRLEMR